VLVGVLGVFAGLIFALVPVIVGEVRKAIDTVPDLIQGFLDGTIRENVEAALPWLDVQGVLNGIENWVNDLDFTSIGTGVLTAAGLIATGVAGAVIVLILTLYFVSSLASIKRNMYQLVPASKRPKFIEISEEVSTAVGRYVMGQGTLALANGILSFIVLALIFPIWVPIEYPALLAFIAFLGSLIPLVGTLSASVIITLSVLLFNGAPSVIWVGIYYLIYMQIEAYVLNPRIMNQAVKVPGVVVVIAALAGGTLLGVLGALVAIPVAAAALIVIKKVVLPKQNEL
jgi:predicted PurR-regulated permease PerM